MKISASFLSIKDNLKENIKKLTSTNIDYLHLDIMDGCFVKNKSYTIEEILEFINYDKPFDVHLMVHDIYKYIDEFKALKPEFITFHLELDEDIMEVINYIKNLNIKVGISIKPETKVETIIPYLPFIDLILVMSVKPGSGGQEFIDIEEKINMLYNLRGDYSYKISVDGGINDKTIKKVIKSDIIVVGSFLTNGDYEVNLNKLKESIYG